VDENRVVVSGVSDGGTGAYYVAMRDTTPYAAFLPLNGSIVVLTNDALEVRGNLYPGNLRNKPLFVVNGGRDPLYPTSAVEPYIRHLMDGGVSILYRPQPNAGHDTSWWPEVKEDFEAFAAQHPRNPLPDRLTWETSDTRANNRAHWLVIDGLGNSTSGLPLDDLNQFTPPAQIELGVRLDGVRVAQVIHDSNFERIGVREGDVILRIGATAIGSAADLVRTLQTYRAKDPMEIAVMRAGRDVHLSGVYDPQDVRRPAAPLFRHSGRSGRVDLMRRGNRVEATTGGVSTFTLLLSPRVFDLTQPVTVVANGEIAFEGRVEPSVATLMKWAARDNDRTSLFVAELKIKVP
jgi:hypothetical protein